MITFGNMGVTLKLSCLAGDSQIASVSITLHDTLQVPASSEVEVMANVPEAASSGTWIVEGSTSGKQTLLVARTLVTPVGESVPLQLLNPRPELVKVTRGSVVALIESVESLECSVIGMTQLSSPVSEVPKVSTQAIDSIVNQLGSHVSSKQQQQLLGLLLNFVDIFAVTPTDFGRSCKLQHHIDAGNARPIRQPL